MTTGGARPGGVDPEHGDGAHDPWPPGPRRLVRPPAWDLLPGRAGTVGIVGPRRERQILRKRLPERWTVVEFEEVRRARDHLSDCRVFCVIPSSGPAAGDETVRTMETAARKARVPVVVFASGSVPERILALRNLVTRRSLLADVGEQGLAQTLREVAVRPVFEYVRAAVRRRFADQYFVASTLEKVVGQVPLPAPLAVEAMSRGEVPFYRKVKDVARLMGVSRTYLWRAFRTEDLVVGDVLRENALLHGMALYRRGNARDVALRLGYAQVESWRASVRRALEGKVNLREERNRRQILARASSQPLGWYADRLLTVLGMEAKEP